MRNKRKEKEKVVKKIWQRKQVMTSEKTKLERKRENEGRTRGGNG